MKKKQFVEQRSKDLGVLEKLVVEKRLELERVSAEISSGKEKNLKKSKNLRRELAQLLTIKKEKEIVAKESKKDKKEQK